MTSKTKDIRCKGCGGILDEESGDVVRIDEGELAEGRSKPKFVKDDDWGYMHVRCFKIAIGDPDAIDVLAEAV